MKRFLGASSLAVSCRSSIKLGSDRDSAGGGTRLPASLVAIFAHHECRTPNSRPFVRCRRHLIGSARRPLSRSPVRQFSRKTSVRHFLPAQRTTRQACSRPLCEACIGRQTLCVLIVSKISISLQQHIVLKMNPFQKNKVDIKVW